MNRREWVIAFVMIACGCKSPIGPMGPFEDRRDVGPSIILPDASMELVGTRPDAGPGGTIVLPDAGTLPDGGSDPIIASRDAGPGPIESNSCELMLGTDVPPLPRACLPRCAITTGQALNACGSDQTCQRNAVMADTTPATPIVINGMATQLNCGMCLTFQQLSCGYDVCPSETMALLQCQDQACADAAQGPFATCVQSEANRTTFNACFQALFMSCFG